jgi:hypothetical protein
MHESLGAHAFSSVILSHSLHPDSLSQDFSPVLNVPALISFLVIALAFVSLQVRVTSIGEAADRRTEALKELRLLKSQQLEGKVTTDQVDEALEKYEQTFNEVEQLRSVLPNVRIRPPPVSAGLAQTRMKENEAAAQQFLGIEPTMDVDDDNKDQGKGGLSLPLAAVLGLVLLSQISLLMLLTSDPMSSSMDPSMTTNAILDTISSSLE